MPRNSLLFLTLLEANIGGAAGPSDVRSGMEDASKVFILDADEEYWDLGRVTTAAEADGSGLWVKFRELQTKCLAVHTDMPAGLVDVVEIAKRIIKLEC